MKSRRWSEKFPDALLLDIDSQRRNRDNCGSFRPVGLTLTVLKALERFLRDKIVNHLEARNLMMVRQQEFWRRS